MDIAKYIGLFLLKNHFCYIHGLGNLELKKKPAVFDGHQLHSSSFEVHVGPAGSIDDNLANFIATNEQISISKAVAALREYSTNAKISLQEGAEVVIPFIGKLVEEYGRLSFITDPYFQFVPPPITTQRSEKPVIAPEPVAAAPQAPQYSSYAAAPASPYTPPLPPPPAPPQSPMPIYEETQPLEQEEYYQRRYYVHPHEDDEPEQINWKRVFLAVGVLVVVIALAIFGLRSLRQDKYARDVAIPQMPMRDSATAPVDLTVNEPSANDTAHLYMVIIDNYSSKGKAEKRASQMKGYGHDVQVLSEDSASFLILMPIRCRPMDTTAVLDSLGGLFNPMGVTIYR